MESYHSACSELILIVTKSNRIWSMIDINKQLISKRWACVCCWVHLVMNSFIWIKFSLFRLNSCCMAGVKMLICWDYGWNSYWLPETGNIVIVHLILYIWLQHLEYILQEQKVVNGLVLIKHLSIYVEHSKHFQNKPFH